MSEIIITELAFLALALISSYLTWGPLTSKEMVDYFGPEIRTTSKLTEDELFERRRKAGHSAEVLRAVMITVFGFVAIPFYSSSLSVMSVLNSPFFQWSFLAVTILVLVYNLYFGPRFFALKYSGELSFRSPNHFKKYIRPYWAWVLYPLLIFGGIGLVLFMLIVGSIAVDIDQLQAYVAQIYSLSTKEVVDIQFAIIRLNEFGGFISSVSQKYMLTSLLIFIYVIIEQRSTMRDTILDSSVERLKYAVWAGLIFTISFSLIILPYQYQELHSYMHNQVGALAVNNIYPEHLGEVLSIQQTLETHDLKWLLFQIFTGYGNLLSASIFAFAVFIWRLFFDEVPVKYILQLVVPKYIIERINRFGEGFRVDMDLKSDKSRKHT